MVYNLLQIQTLFSHSKLAWWKLYANAKLVDEYTLVEGDPETAWNHLINISLPTHPFGTYTLKARTSEGNNRGERNLPFHHAAPERTPAVNGHPAVNASIAPDFLLKIMDKRDADRSVWETEKEKLVERFTVQIQEEKTKNAKLEGDLRDLKNANSIRQIKDELLERQDAMLAKMKPRAVREKPSEKMTNRFLNVLEKGAVIAGHHFGVPLANLSALSGVGEPTEDEDEEAQESGITAKQKALLYATLAFFAEHFEGLDELAVLKIMNMMMSDEKGQELKTMIYAYFQK